MKLKSLSFSLLACMLMGGVNAAWAGTIDTMGSTTTGWGSAYHDYTLPAGKTLTLNFTVAETLNTNNWDGWCINTLRKTAPYTVYYFTQCSGSYLINGKWDEQGAVTFNSNTYNFTTFKSDLQGALVELSVKRLASEIAMLTRVTTTSSNVYYHYFVIPCDAGDDDLTITLGADNARLTSITDVISDTETISGTLIGLENNTGGFGAGTPQDFIVAPNGGLTLHFKNYSNKLSAVNSWTLEIQQGSKYFDLGSDNRIWQNGGANWITTDNVTWNTPGTSYYDWGTYVEDMYGADCVVTLTRSGQEVTITALQTSIAGKDFGKTCTFTMTEEEAAENFTVRLLTEGGHLDLLPVTAEVSTYGWATFSSDYALDFSKATDGLTAYKVTGATGNVVDMTPVTGTVPAGTGLLLKGAAGNYNIPIVGSSDTDMTGNLMIAGTGAQVNDEDGYTNYVLGVAGEKAVFQYIGTTPATVAKGKAYLHLTGDKAASAPTLYFDWATPTAIEAVDAQKAQQAGVVYNLAGQRVAQPKKGLYIVNGKKIMK